MLILNNCKLCNKLTARKNYCSVNCYYQSRRNRVKVINCLYCNKQIEVKLSDKRLFCSNSCSIKKHYQDKTGCYSQKSRNKLSISKMLERVTLICLNCNKEFKVRITEKDIRKCCCLNCSSQYSGKLRHEKAQENLEERECILCKNKFSCHKNSSKQICSIKCRGKYQANNYENSRLILYCKNCNKEMIKPKCHSKRQFCSKKCSSQYSTKYKIGWHSDKTHDKLNQYRKENNIGFYNKKLASIAGSAGVKTQIKNKSGFHNPINQLKASQLGFNVMCKGKNIEFNDILFMSKSEAEIAMNLFYQFNVKLVLNETTQAQIGSLFYDFFIKELKCFLEYHQIIPYFDKNETEESYYNARRQNLDDNGYKDYDLIIIFE